MDVTLQQLLQELIHVVRDNEELREANQTLIKRVKELENVRLPDSVKENK